MFSNRDKRNAHSLPLLAEKALSDESIEFPGKSAGEIIIQQLIMQAEKGKIEAAKTLCRLVKIREQEKRLQERSKSIAND